MISWLWSFKHKKELLVKRKLERLKLKNEKQKCRSRKYSKIFDYISERIYIELTEGPFKERLSDHCTSFKYEQ